MGLRNEFRLIDIAARSVTSGAESLLLMACLTLGPLLRGCNTVREFEVQVMSFGQFHSLAAISRCNAWRPRRSEVPARKIYAHKVRTVMTVGACFLRMTGCTGCSR